MKQERCNTKYCRNPVGLRVEGIPLCDDCWVKRCEERERAWRERQVSA